MDPQKTIMKNQNFPVSRSKLRISMKVPSHLKILNLKLAQIIKNWERKSLHKAIRKATIEITQGSSKIESNLSKESKVSKSRSIIPPALPCFEAQKLAISSIFPKLRLRILKKWFQDSTH